MTITFIEIVGFAAFLTNVAGNLMLVWQTAFGWYGWAMRILAIVLWFAYAFDTADLPLIANAVTFFCINCWGVWKWRRDRKLA